MNNNEEYKFTNIGNFIQAMHELSSDTNPGKYIEDYTKLLQIKDIIIEKFFEIFIAMNERCPNIRLSAEGRIKTYPSYLEKIYTKTKDNLEKDNSIDPIIYDMSAFRIIVVSIIDSLEQVVSMQNERTKKLEYYYRVRNKEDSTKSGIKKINIGDIIHIDNNTTIKVSEDNLITNYDGSISIKNEFGDLFTLNGRKIEKDDRSSTMNAVYEVRKALENYTKTNGFQYIPIRDKDRIANPKRIKHTFKDQKFSKEQEIQIKERIRFLKNNPDKRHYNRNAYLPEYQSYHLGYYDPTTGYPFEIQLRSLYMHRVAEYNQAFGHNSYKKLEIDDSAPLRIPITFVFKKSYQDGKIVYEKELVDEDYLYKKTYNKTKKEVFAEIARNKTLLQIGLPEDPEL